MNEKIKEKINIVPVICKTKYDNLGNIEMINSVEFLENESSKFCVSILSSIYCKRSITIQLIMRSLKTGMMLDMGTLNIVKESDIDKKDELGFTLLNLVHFFNVDTYFPSKGRYVLEIYLTEGENKLEFLKEQVDNSKYEETVNQVISATTIDVI